MTVSIFSGCSDGCGWIAALVASLAAGSFGVPIKATVKIEVAPFAIQTYKVFVLFVTCWLVLLLGEDIRWTPWGIVSGMFYVPAGTSGIYAIQNAGLAIAVGTWSSVIVLSSFFWGIVMFGEGVKDIHETMVAFFLLCIGLLGMSNYAAATPPSTSPHNHKLIEDTNATNTKEKVEEEVIEEAYEEPDRRIPRGGDNASAAARKRVPAPQKDNSKRLTSTHNNNNDPSSHGMTRGSDTNHTVERSPSSLTKSLSIEMEQPLLLKDKDKSANNDFVILWGGRISIHRRQLGICCAVFNGAWGSMYTVPMHYAAKDGFGGANYLISFGTGCSIVCSSVWVILFVYQLFRTGGHVHKACQALPSLRIQDFWLPGLLTGFLNSLATFGGLTAVQYLGQAVGYSVCQSSILVSGLWGIFYFQEIQGCRTIACWFISAIITLTSIVILSYEHKM